MSDALWRFGDRDLRSAPIGRPLLSAYPVRTLQILGAACLNKFIKHFVREAPGIWTCIEPAELLLPQGRVQVTAGTRFTTGFKFMGVELARLLEEQYELDRRQGGSNSPA